MVPGGFTITATQCLKTFQFCSAMFDTTVELFGCQIFVVVVGSKAGFVIIIAILSCQP